MENKNGTIPHENLYITGAVIGSLYLYLSAFGMSDNSNKTVPYIGLFGLSTSLTYLISRKAFKATTHKSLIASAVTTATIATIILSLYLINKSNEDAKNGMKK